jgi:hypothetical protein
LFHEHFTEFVDFLRKGTRIVYQGDGQVDVSNVVEGEFSILS